MKKTLFGSILSTVLILQGFLPISAAAQTVAPMYATPSAVCPALSFNLYRGLSDYYTRGQVSQLQQFLANQGYYQPVSGYYGPLTTANVANFQRQYAVYPVTGGVGPLTRAAIAKVCGGTSGGVTQGALNAIPTSGNAPLLVYFTGSVSNSGQYIISYGDGATSGPVQANCLSNQPYPGYSGSGYNCAINSAHTYANAGTYTAVLSPYIACMYSNPRCMIATQTLGQVTIMVGQQTVGGVTVTSPAAGQNFVRGDQMQITWGYPVTPNSTQMAIELYTASGDRMGLIAVSGNTSGSYAWHIPGYPQNYMCTLQYPNGLCGTNIPSGQYYIKVSTTNNPLDANPTVIASGTSGIFTIFTQ